MLSNKPKRFDNMNVIPLIDVMLVLLAIVLITASFIVKDSLNIELPETQNTQSYVPPEDKVVLHFHIDESNQLYMDEIPQTLNQVKAKLMKLAKTQAITLQVDKKTDFGTFVSLVDELKGQQLNNLTILTKSHSE